MIARIRRYWNHLAELYPDPLDFQHARLLAALGGLSLLISVVFLLGIILGGGEAAANPLSFLLMLLPAGMGIAVLVMLSQQRLQTSRWLVFIYYVLLSGVAALYLDLLSYAAALLIFPMLIGSGLFGLTGILAGAGLSLLFTALAVVGEYIGLLPEQITDSTLLVPGITTILAVIFSGALLLWFILGPSYAALMAARRRIRRMETVNEVGRYLMNAGDSERFLPDLVELIRDRIGVYHAQIFMVDEFGENAVVQASTGELGVQLLARGHQLPVGSRSVIGQVTALGKMVYASNVTASGVHRSNELLSATRSEIAFPLLDGETVIGALDLQSTRPNEFTQDDIETLFTLSMSISAGLRNSRRIQQQEQHIERLNRQHDETRRQLIDAERLNRQLTRETWEDYLTGDQTVLGIRIDGADVDRQVGWSKPLAEAITRDRMVVEPAPDGEAMTVAVPMEVRGLTLGAIEVTLPPHTSMEDAEELIQSVANRLALALDNNRLFEEASTRAEQERKIGQIGSQFQGTLEVDEMLQIAIRELQSAIGASRGSIRLRAMTPVEQLADSGQE